MNNRYALLVLLLINVCSNACEPSSIFTNIQNPINSAQAQSALSNSLFRSANDQDLQTSDVTALINSIDCYLSVFEHQHEKLPEIRTALNGKGQALLLSTTSAQQRLAIGEVSRTVARDAGTGFVVFPIDRDNTVEIDLFNSVLARNCQSRPSVECAESLSLAQNLWQIAGHYSSLANSFNQQDKLDSLAFNENLDRQWRSYKEDTIKLWPQEVLLNSLVYQPSSTGMSGPPNYKLLSLRPALGLSYLSDQSNHIQPTLNLDVLGIYWWKYRDSKATPGRGIAASVVWDGDDTAYGLSYYHNPKWSATLAQGKDNDLVISISFQLAYWFLKK